jgi:hypothetical protein
MIDLFDPVQGQRTTHISQNIYWDRKTEAIGVKFLFCSLVNSERRAVNTNSYRHRHQTPASQPVRKLFFVSLKH